MTDEQDNNKFEPNKIGAHQGDVIGSTLKLVHNVDFFADSNVVKTGLPAASALLQLPGQTADLKVTLAEVLLPVRPARRVKHERPAGGRRKGINGSSVYLACRSCV
jgi:hypothetical protein